MATGRWLQVIVHQKAVNDVRPKTNCKTVALPREESTHKISTVSGRKMCSK